LVSNETESHIMAGLVMKLGKVGLGITDH